MNIRDLSYVIAVEQHGSITRAAEACEVTQPTLSAQLAKLERELGVELFERDGRGLKLTPAGRTVLEHAKRIVAAVDDLVHAANEHRDPLAGTLRLGLIPTLAPYLLPHLLPAMRERLPRLTPIVVEEQTAVLLERLRAGTLDAAMIATNVADERLAELALFDEPLWVALPEKHPLAAREAIKPGDLDPATLLLLSEGHCLRDQALELCRHPSLGVELHGDFRASSIETVLNLVQAGLGITLVPDLYLKRSHSLGAGLVLRPLASKNAYRPISLAFRRSTARHSLLTELASTTRKVWTTLSS
jgi:LysR family hydrogen peroxide-inducible transcriptional activator